jgi:hypothetical protein
MQKNSLKNCVGKTTVFSAINVKGIRYTLWMRGDTGVKDVDTHSLILLEDGSINSEYPRDWLYILELFELEVSARKASKEIGLSYPTVLKGYNIIRRAILVQDKAFPLLKGEIEADETYFGGRRKGRHRRGAEGKVPVFGIIERKGKVRVEVVKDIFAGSLLRLAIKRVRRGSIVYTDKFKSYDSLMFCGYRPSELIMLKDLFKGKSISIPLKVFGLLQKRD